MGAVLYAVGTDDLSPAAWVLGGGAALATYLAVLVVSGEVTLRDVAHLVRGVRRRLRRSAP